MTNNSIIRDRFVQEIDTGHGQLWRSAVLVDLSDGDLELLAQRVASGLVHSVRSQRRSTDHEILLSAGILVTVTCVLATLMNSLGRWRERVRTRARARTT